MKKLIPKQHSKEAYEQIPGLRRGDTAAMINSYFNDRPRFVKKAHLPSPRTVYGSEDPPPQFPGSDTTAVGVADEKGHVERCLASVRPFLPPSNKKCKVLIERDLDNLEKFFDFPVCTDESEELKPGVMENMILHQYAPYHRGLSNVYEAIQMRLDAYDGVIKTLSRHINYVYGKPGHRMFEESLSERLVQTINITQEKLNLLLVLSRSQLHSDLRTRQRSSQATTEAFEQQELLVSQCRKLQQSLGISQSIFRELNLVERDYTYNEVAARFTAGVYTRFLEANGWNGLCLPDSFEKAQRHGFVLDRTNAHQLECFIRITKLADAERQARADAEATKPLEWTTFVLSRLDANGKTGFHLDPRPEPKLTQVRSFSYLLEGITPVDDTVVSVFPMFLVTSPAQVAWTTYQVYRVYGVNLLPIWWATLVVLWRGPSPD